MVEENPTRPPSLRDGNGEEEDDGNTTAVPMEGAAGATPDIGHYDLLTDPSFGEPAMRWDLHRPICSVNDLHEEPRGIPTSEQVVQYW